MTHDDHCLGYEEEVRKPVLVIYEASDVKELLRKYEADLKAYREVEASEGMPGEVMTKQQILTDALALLYYTLKEEEDEEE